MTVFHTNKNEPLKMYDDGDTRFLNTDIKQLRAYILQLKT